MECLMNKKKLRGILRVCKEPVSNWLYIKLDFSEIVRSTDAYVRVQKLKCSQLLVEQWSNIFCKPSHFFFDLGVSKKKKEEEIAFV